MAQERTSEHIVPCKSDTCGTETGLCSALKAGTGRAVSDGAEGRNCITSQTADTDIPNSRGRKCNFSGSAAVSLDRSGKPQRP